jgi:uncharacterized membrane protein YjfL (UPF0719 family)
MHEHTTSTAKKDLKDFQKSHSPWVAAAYGAIVGLVPPIALAVSHDQSVFYGYLAVVTVTTAVHLESSRRKLASLQEELKRVKTK